ncbi:MAG: lysine--tRNA ligase [Anaerolineaceae bacterium]|nr:lysine--tRNA ligase [Anaerolineaceae bacterium]
MQYWADEMIAGLPQEEFVFNDSKTYSGSAHVGSLRGPVIHDVLYRSAVDAGRRARFLYGNDDMDALDAVPPGLSQERYRPWLGKPLCEVPSPDGSPRSYARFFYDEFMGAQHKLGIWPEPYHMSELYRSGRMNGVIRTLIEAADELRAIYLEVSQSGREESWIPFSPVCENCGRIAMTRVHHFDGERVHYRCLPNAMPYAPGCGHEGAVEPWDGAGKLPWKLEWAARWQVLGVNFEGAGSDHSIAGGSRDVADAISRRVFCAEPPANLPYEFLLLEGGKMSSSKGIGLSAHEATEALPAQQLRWLQVRTRPRTAINFNLGENAIPRLFDDFDVAGERYRDGSAEGWQRRQFELAQVRRDPDVTSSYRPRFAHVVTISQIPGLDAEAYFSQHKGAPLNAAERDELRERIAYARIWLDRFAPAKARFEVQGRLPPEVKSLDAAQRLFLSSFASWYEGARPADGESIHVAIMDLARREQGGAGFAFRALYRIFLGRSSGPRAGEFLAALEPAFVRSRLKEAVAALD